MPLEEEKCLKALIDINAALITGLQSAIALLEKYEKCSEEQREAMISKLKQLLDASRLLYEAEPTKH
jgi:hypothetical protein